ncbi:hypothetical protein GCM10011514_30430 [Emticicia aquatilis]|uniref:Lipoprotein n=1 Tax=Emticicia aquatilis TaxID=1537369 RepID=A0A916YXD5_9BACT|nr:hypothetical protein [Emticicia aquatilis]GGD64375.1 hypothetical protein GCM10011514_30430 [Emticicia aquatilis]
MRKLLFLIIVLVSSCKNSKIANQTNQLSYLVKKIDSKNNWNIIYASKQDSIFKIIVRKEVGIINDCEKIVVGGYYLFKLHSRKKDVPDINGIKIEPINNLDIQCYSYDNETSICIEPKKGIFDLHHAENIKGLCLIK